MKDFIKTIISSNIDLKKACLSDENLMKSMKNAMNICVECFQSGGKVFFCGNGGSAADAQHLASEFSGKFYLDRQPLFAEALHVNTSHLTAVANDYSFEEVYSRLIEAKGNKGDLLFAISTSGRSPNIVKAIEKANELEMTTVALTGNDSSAVISLCDIAISVPSSDTPRVQECHILLGHIICEYVEEKMFGGGEGLLL